jgi:magnesium transporter
VWVYDRESEKLTRVEKLEKPGEGMTAWVHMETGDDEEKVKEVLQAFGAHEMVLRAVQEGSDRPRLSMFRDHAYLSFYALDPDGEARTEIGMMIGANFLLTLAERKLPFLEQVRERIEAVPQKMSEPGRVLYIFLDCLCEQYLSLVDRIVKEVQQIEKAVFDNPFENEIGHRLYRFKRNLHKLRRIVEEEHTIVRTLCDPDFPYAEEESGFFFQDLDHSFSRIVDAFDRLKEEMGGIFDLQMSLKSDHMNAIMKTLTLVSVMFLPLTFLTGVYGTNFEYLPELKWRYSYFVLWGVMLTVVASLIAYFKKRRWW